MKKMILILIAVSIMCFAGKLNINYNDGTSSTEIDFSEIIKIQIAPKGFVVVEGGAFQMGDHFSEGDTDELPVHTVTLSDFYMGSTEVTQAEWNQYMPADSYNYGTGDTYPAYYVTWYEIVKYCNLRSMAEGLTPCYTISSSTDPVVWGTVPTSTNTAWNAVICNWSANGYRLPTEAEWEYAARGGIHNTDNLRYSGCNLGADLTNYAWYGNTTGTSHQVGTKLPNQLGLYDMSGNLWEWCWDWNSSYTSESVTNPTGSTTVSYRIVRGGFWGYPDYYCTVSWRYGGFPSDSTYLVGFRLSRTP